MQSGRENNDEECVHTQHFICVEVQSAGGATYRRKSMMANPPYRLVSCLRCGSFNLGFQGFSAKHLDKHDTS